MAAKGEKARTLTAEEAAKLHRIVAAFRKVAGNLDALVSEIEEREESEGKTKAVPRRAESRPRRPTNQSEAKPRRTSKSVPE